MFSEKPDVPNLTNQSMVAISVMELWPWKLGQGHQNWISYWSCLIYMGLQIGSIQSNGPWDNMQTNTFWLKFGGLSLAVTLKIRSRSAKHIQLFIMSNCYIHANPVHVQLLHPCKCASWFMRYWAHKHLLAQIWHLKSRSDLDTQVKVPKT